MTDKIFSTIVKAIVLSVGCWCLYGGVYKAATASPEYRSWQLCHRRAESSEEYLACGVRPD